MAVAVADEDKCEPGLSAAFGLFSCLPPTKNAENLALVRAFLPDLPGTCVPVPSRIVSVPAAAGGKEFLTSEYAKQESNAKTYYKCPWNGAFYAEDGERLDSNATEPSSFDVALNEAVATYCNLYYGSEGMVSSAFVLPGGSNFTVVIQIKKAVSSIVDGAEDDGEEFPACAATWDTTHVFEIAKGEEADKYEYTHRATLQLSFDSRTEQPQNAGQLQCLLAGNLSREQQHAVLVPSGGEHLPAIGRQLEEMESRLRNEVQTIYFGRPHDAINELRRAVPEGFLRNQKDLRAEMAAALAQRHQ